ncbi:diguanylate cyclase [Vibrio cholerae]|nr:diguanylate cyclase [Vibrio cholerae]EJL6606979.1 diguanylate cyclase [Vibrio cholerae]EJL6661442.1 diguanylate cyclase [Vibrio cholerae]GHW73235.1 diguanylate cyclase [Vibrio cholerae]
MIKPTSRSFIATKHIGYVVAWLLFFMIVVVVSCLLFFLKSLDSVAKNDLVQRVDYALKLEAKYGRDLIEEYTYWDYAYTKIFIERDAVWINNNIGNCLMPKGGYDFSVGVFEGDKEAFLIGRNDAHSIDFNKIMNPVFELMNLSKGADTITKLVDGFFLIDSEVYHVIGGPFIDEKLKTNRSDAFLALGRRVDSEYINKLKVDYQLFDLRLVYNIKGSKYYTAIKSHDGVVIGYLLAHPRNQSKNIILIIILVIAIFSLAIIIVIKILLNKERISREEYESKLFIEATTDALTKLNNRRYFMEIGRRELNAYKLLKDKEFSIIIIDIDHFKSINDLYGHSVGDKALTHFARLCLTEIRESDILGRLGGEEFAIILPNTSSEKAFEVANRIRFIVCNTPFISLAKSINFTVSIGVASMSSKKDTLESMLDKADKALYKAKSEGRNRVIIYNA